MTEQSADKQNEAGLTKFQKIDIKLKIAGVVLALATLAIFYCQFRGLRDQTKAIWYSNRPVLRIAPIDPSRDIQPFKGEITRSGGTFFDSTHYSKLSFTIENVGNTPASVDKIYYELVTRDTVVCHTSSYGDLPSLPKDRAVAPMYLLLPKGETNIFKIEITYNWERPVDVDEKFILEKHFVADYAQESWQLKILSSEQYRAEKEQFCQGKDF